MQSEDTWMELHTLHRHGWSIADRKRLFERYARGTLPGAEGTGLGLYVSRELARANGGDLVLDAADPGASGQAAGSA